MAIETRMQAAHAECAIEGVAKTFAAIYGDEPQYEVTGEDIKQPEVVSSIVSIVGGVAWSLMLSFPPETATKLAAGFAGFEIPFESDDMLDVTGELANVAAGDIVQRLDAKGVQANLSIPTVTRGREVRTLCPGSESTTTVQFSAREGVFWLTLCAAN